MMTLVGLGVALACIFGGYVAAGGKFGIIMAALPFEMLIIGGSAAGTFLMANSVADVKHTLHGFGKILKGARYKKSDSSRC